MNIVMAQLNLTIGDIEGNGRKILDTIDAHGASADLIVFSELCVTGYYPRDLLYRENVLAAQDAMIERIALATRGLRAAVVLGAVGRNTVGIGKPFHNSLLVLCDGRVVYRYSKRLLPTYGVFDESRHFEPGQSIGLLEINGTKLGFLICEDAWASSGRPLYDEDPVSSLMMQGPDLVVSINASPCDTDKLSRRFQVIDSVARRCSAPVVYVNQVGGIDDLVFDGTSMVVCQGEVLGQARSFEEDVVTVDIDRAVRRPFQPVTGMAMIAQQLRRGLIDYCAKSGFSKVVIGSSGGIDSAVTLALAAWALGPENVVAITMPSKYSSAGSVDDSQALCDALGTPLLHAPIRQQFELAVAEYEANFGAAPGQLAQENLQARLRGQLLMTYSNSHGALVLTTGNKSELSVGYCTLHGDMCGGLAVIGDLYKLEVFALAEYLNAEIFGREVIPRAIIEKEPSAELAPDQRDVDALPPYEQLDAILRLFIEGDLLSDEECEALNAITREIAPAEVARIHRLVDRNEYKRRQAAPVIRVQKRAFGFDRQIPLTSRVA